MLQSPFFSTREDLPIETYRDNLINSISQDVGILTVVVDPDPTKFCYELTSDMIDLYGDNFIEIAEATKRYVLYYGNFFNKDLMGKISCDELIDPGEIGYSYGNYREEKIIVYEKITSLKGDYESNYLTLKNSLDIADFEFKFFDDNLNEIEALSVEANIPDNVNVYTREFPVTVINENAEINYYTFRVRVW
jgi:hypothetical protein